MHLLVKRNFGVIKMHGTTIKIIKKRTLFTIEKIVPKPTEIFLYCTLFCKTTESEKENICCSLLQDNRV